MELGSNLKSNTQILLGANNKGSITLVISEKAFYNFSIVKIDFDYVISKKAFDIIF